VRDAVHDWEANRLWKSSQKKCKMRIISTTREKYIYVVPVSGGQ
jgi:hypothetical protein